MTPRQIASHALASALSMGLIGTAQAHQPGDDPPGKERCYGVSRPGENHCANLAGTHDCAGQSAVDKDPGEWQYVARGSCKKLKGLSVAEATARFKAAAKATPSAAPTAPAPRVAPHATPTPAPNPTPNPAPNPTPNPRLTPSASPSGRG